MKKLLFLFIVLLFVSCTSAEKNKEYRGKYTYGHEIEIFTDEQTGQDYWLEGNIEGLNEYMQDIMKNNNIQYPYVKIEIEGKDKGEATNELAQVGDRVLEVRKWKFIK